MHLHVAIHSCFISYSSFIIGQLYIEICVIQTRVVSSILVDLFACLDKEIEDEEEEPSVKKPRLMKSRFHS